MRDDWQALAKGIIQILPDDDHGRAALFFDRTRMCNPHLTRGEIVRIRIYDCYSRKPE